MGKVPIHTNNYRTYTSLEGDARHITCPFSEPLHRGSLRWQFYTINKSGCHTLASSRQASSHGSKLKDFLPEPGRITRAFVCQNLCPWEVQTWLKQAREGQIDQNIGSNVFRWAILLYSRISITLRPYSSYKCSTSLLISLPFHKHFFHLVNNLL